MLEYITKLRESINSRAKSYGNKIYEGLGDSITKEVNKEGTFLIAISLGSLFLYYEIIQIAHENQKQLKTLTTRVQKINQELRTIGTNSNRDLEEELR